MRIPGVLTNILLDKFIGKISKSKDLSPSLKNSPEPSLRYIYEALQLATEIDELEQEIHIILGRLGNVSNGLIISYSIEELVIGIKHYLIAWSTMKDLMGVLISTIFNLGLHEKDINFGLLQRNTKIQQTKILEIFKKYKHTIDVSGTDNKRNEAVHRGKLMDKEIKNYKDMLYSLSAKQYGLLSTDEMSEAEYKEKLSAIKTQLPSLVKSRKVYYSEHFSETLKLNKELVEVLAKEATVMFENNKI